MIVVPQATIGEQTETIATVPQRVSDLERRRGSSGGRGVPGVTPKQRSKASGPPRKQRARGDARVRMTPTAIVPQAAAHCPDCGRRWLGGWVAGWLGGWVTRHRAVIEAPAAPVRVTDHQIRARRWPRCQRLVLPADPRAGIGMGTQRCGVRLISLLATLGDGHRLPVTQIQRLVAARSDLRLSTGSITATAASDRGAATGQAGSRAIRDRIRGSPSVPADEPGGRQTGRNGDGWRCSTPSDR